MQRFISIATTSHQKARKTGSNITDKKRRHIVIYFKSSGSSWHFTIGIDVKLGAKKKVEEATNTFLQNYRQWITWSMETGPAVAEYERTIAVNMKEVCERLLESLRGDE